MANPSNKDISTLVREKLGFRIFSYEYKIIASLHENGKMSAGDISSIIGCSPATFHNKIRHLSLRDAVLRENDELDQRKHLYRLTQPTIETINREMLFIKRWRSNAYDMSSEDNLKSFMDRFEKSLRIRIFSSPYRVILGIYDHKAISTVDLEKWCGIPSRSFYKILDELVSSGSVIKVADNSGKRKMLNSLSPDISALLHKAHTNLEAWVDGLPTRQS